MLPASVSHLHPTMYLLILWLRESQSHYHLYLHPTMYLLIPPTDCQQYKGRINLHPTMYLLILTGTYRPFPPFLYLHPTMYLLIHEMQLAVMAYNLFTSHYVSINSNLLRLATQLLIHLHPTMYLLILNGRRCNY